MISPAEFDRRSGASLEPIWIKNGNPAKVFIFASTEPPLKVFVVPASDLPDREWIYMDGRPHEASDPRLDQIGECLAPAAREGALTSTYNTHGDKE